MTYAHIKDLLLRAIHTRKGFTIVELTVVIVVIAILASITIVSYTRIVQDSRDKAVASSAIGMATELTKYKADNGRYPSDLSVVSWKNPDGATFQYDYDAMNNTYCLTTSVGSASAYVVSGDSTTRKGGCPGHGLNGEPPITNLASDPAATKYTTPNTAAGWRSDRYSADGTYTLVTGAEDGPVDGLKTYARLQITRATPNGRGFHIVGNPEAASTGGNGMPIEAGKTYTVSAYVRNQRLSGAVVYAMGVRFVDSSNAWVGSNTSGGSAISEMGSPVTSPGPWVRAWVTVTAPASATKMHAYVREVASGGHVSGDRIEGTGLMITEGSKLHAYADGDSAGWKWTGTPHNSPSVGPAK